MMNEREKAEFEMHKKRAEQQLNDMYYGSKANKQELKMPTFLSQPKQNTAKNSNSEQNNSYKNNINKKQSTFNNKSANSNGINKSFKDTQKPKSDYEKKVNGFDILNMFNLKNFSFDSDRLLIMALCLLLSSEPVDETLLFALIYIML